MHLHSMKHTGSRLSLNMSCRCSGSMSRQVETWHRDLGSIARDMLPRIAHCAETAPLHTLHKKTHIWKSDIKRRESHRNFQNIKLLCFPHCLIFPWNAEYHRIITPAVIPPKQQFLFLISAPPLCINVVHGLKNVNPKTSSVFDIKSANVKSANKHKIYITA